MLSVRKCETPDLSLPFCHLSHLQGHTLLYTCSPSPVCLLPSLPWYLQEGEAHRCKERERHLNTPSATSNPPRPDLIPSINLIMEQIDVKADSTGMSTVVGTDSLAFATSKLGARDWTSEFTPGSDQCSTLTSILPMAQVLGGRALELASIQRLAQVVRASSWPGPQFTHMWEKIETISTTWMTTETK